jgi:hypothetical protein
MVNVVLRNYLLPVTMHATLFNGMLLNIPLLTVDGGWTEWTWEDVDECSVMCGGGTKDQERSRECSNPAPQFGGASCAGDDHQTQDVTCGQDECGGGWSGPETS